MTKINFKDSITSVAFDDEDNLIASSWDGHIALCTAKNSPAMKSQSNVIVLNVENIIPQIDCLFAKRDKNMIAAIGLDDTLNIYSKKEGCLISSYIIDKADDLFKLDSSDSFFILGDRHKNIFLFDDRSKKTIASYSTLSVISQMKLIDNKSLICSDKENIFYYDIRKLNKPLRTIPNSFKSDIEAIAYMPKEALIYGGSEGRISVEYFDETKNQNHSFKCHRKETESSLNVYSVNALEYDNQREVLYSGGSDGHILGWKIKEKKKVFQSKQYKEPISHLALNQNSNMIAIGVSWLNEDGKYDTSNHEYYIDIINVDELS